MTWRDIEKLGECEMQKIDWRAGPCDFFVPAGIASLMVSAKEAFMRRGIKIVSVSVALVSLFALKLRVSSVASLPVVHAQEESSSCSQQSLAGRYSVEAGGTVVAQLPGLPAPPFPFGEVGIDTFTANGTWSGQVTANFGGLVAPVTVTGTYTLNRDCTGTRTYNTSVGLVAHDAFVVTDGGRSLVVTQTDPFAVVQRKLTKLQD
jgi:hypothetical protein